MKLLRWSCGVTKLDRIRSERIRGTVKVTEMSKNIHDRRLQWYGHVMRRSENYVGKRVMTLQVEGTRGRGRPKRRWMESVKEDPREKGLVVDEFEDRGEWCWPVKNANPV